jgi:SAM-dependent methyltransferase
LERVLANRGYRLESAAGDGDNWINRFYDDSSALPAGAAEYLRDDNPRLVALRAAYEALDWPVSVRARWRDEGVAWTDLAHFRGDTPYVWHYRDRDRRTSELKYFVFLSYILGRDRKSLVTELGEDGAFGCWTYRFPGYPACSRDLLDSVNEIYFLDATTSLLSASPLRVLDIGAGYGRLAHRVGRSAAGLEDYACVDAIPESTFLCEYYVSFRELSPPVRVLPLPDVQALEPGSFDIAFNVHSFSEIPLVAVEWWVQQLVRLGVPKLFLVPNEPDGFLTLEPDQSRRDYGAVLSAAGYELIAEERKFIDEAVRELVGINDRYCLFQRQA